MFQVGFLSSNLPYILIFVFYAGSLLFSVSDENLNDIAERKNPESTYHSYIPIAEKNISCSYDKGRYSPITSVKYHLLKTDENNSQLHLLKKMQGVITNLTVSQKCYFISKYPNRPPPYQSIF
jgi:hypothetical protein